MQFFSINIKTLRAATKNIHEKYITYEIITSFLPIIITKKEKHTTTLIVTIPDSIYQNIKICEELSVSMYK